MKKCIVTISVVVLLFTILSPIFGGTRNAVVWQGANQTDWTTAEIQTQAQSLRGTGVNWVMLEVLWGWSEPNAPTATPQGPQSYFGPTVQAYHNYNFNVLDQVVNEMRAGNLQIVMRLDHHSTWAGGNPCVGFQPQCGIIDSNHKQTFKDNWYDFAYNVASRYPDVAVWVLWNEPNLGENFSPQNPINPTGIVSEYIDLIQIPGYNAIQAVVPGARMVGPDLYTSYNGGDGQTCDYWGHCLNWRSGWTDSLLRYFTVFFETFSIHNNSDDERGQISAVSQVWNNMVALGAQRRIWLTEFNYRNGTCSDSEWSIAGWAESLYLQMTWERSFYFTLQDSAGTGCGFGLLVSRDYGFWQKPILYPRFQQIVAETP